MILTALEKEIVNELLALDLQVVARSLGLREDLAPRVPERLAVAALNMCERLSRRAVDDASKNACVLVCGLLWEHRLPEWHALTPMIVTILSRLGLAPACRMVDPVAKGETEDGKLSSLGSLRTQLAVTAHQELFTVHLAQGPLVLTRFQRDLWEAMDRFERIAVSAPTSAGKSFALAQKLAQTIANHRTVIYVVPTLSLIQQVTRDVRAALHSSNVEARVMQTLVRGKASSDVPAVFVLTQERAYSALAAPEELKNVGLLIVDEIQNLERVADVPEERARVLHDVVRGFADDVRPKQIVVAGPRLAELPEFGKELLGPETRTVSENLPPVVNLTYAFALEKKDRKRLQSIRFRQHVPGWDSQHSLVLDEAASYPANIFEKKQYTDDVYQTIRHVASTLQPAGGTLIFSPTSTQARRTASSLASARPKLGNGTPQAALARYIRLTVHKAYDLADAVETKVGYHHGKMPAHARIATELAFADGDLDMLACTTTLLQGVNLPAKNIIVRNPWLFTRQRDESATLSSYEFANLRGRAGRLLKDFVGRAVVLDEGTFHKEQVEFSFPEKRVSTGYGERFRQHGDSIIERITSLKSVPSGADDIATYIRHTILRHGGGAVDRLSRVGIFLSSRDLDAARRAVGHVRVPPQILRECPSWDPLVLESIRLRIETGRLEVVPRSAGNYEFQGKVRAVIDTLEELAPDRFEKDLGREGKRLLAPIMITAQNWAGERPLPELLGWRDGGREPSAEDIASRLDTLHKYVTFKLPSLLRPVVLLQDATNPILGSIELGAYRPRVRRLIELGLPREVALSIADGLPRGLDADDVPGLLRAVDALRPALSGWEARIVDTTLF